MNAESRARKTAAWQEEVDAASKALANERTAFEAEKAKWYEAREEEWKEELSRRKIDLEGAETAPAPLEHDPNSENEHVDS